MATIVKLSSGNYRVQVRRKGQYASKTFRRKADAYSWVQEAERWRGQACVEIRNCPSVSRTPELKAEIATVSGMKAEWRKPQSGLGSQQPGPKRSAGRCTNLRKQSKFSYHPCEETI